MTTMGVLDKQEGEELALTQCFPDSNSGALNDRIEAMKENCGWELKMAGEVGEMSPPRMDELILLRLFDPCGFIIG